MTNLTGMNRHTGAVISGEARLAQDLTDLLTTPLGSRVMRRDYGSRLPELIDAPQNAATRLLICAATVGAIRRWIPRIRVHQVNPLFAANGVSAIHLEYTPAGAPRGPTSPLAIQL